MARTRGVRHSQSDRGFALLDLILVVTILGIVTAVAVQANSSDALRVDAAARAIAADLTEAQSMAIETGEPCGILFDTARNRYAFAGDDGALLAVSEAGLKLKVGLLAADVDRLVTSATAGDTGLSPVTLTAATFDGSALIVFGPDGAPRASGFAEVALGPAVLRVRVQAATGRITITAP